MDAQGFWDHLEFRVCREIDGLRRTDFRGLWCDGFLPDALEFTDGRPEIAGKVWMGRGGTTGQELWRFSLLLPRDVKTEADVDWASLLPAEDATGWLVLDKSRQYMKIDPSAAHPDLQLNIERSASSPDGSQ